ncbi:hypothetical protein FQN50_002896 [Emmonsiellopsis sp. PD_5]|nr:hypothetical protein FQN50_002896 [Emmonsiellopsis sp. PD_5]
MKFSSLAAVAALAATNALALHLQPRQEPATLQSGDYELVITPGDVEQSVAMSQMASGTVLFVEEQPLQILVKNGDVANSASGKYATVTTEEGGLVGTGDVFSASGSVFSFEDRYEVASNGGFAVTRTVSVGAANGADQGFNSRFTFGPTNARDIQDYDFLAPGVWYGRNEHVPDHALASDLNNEYFYFREMRLPLPFIMMHDSDSGQHLSLAHQDASPASPVDEPNGSWWVDEGITYAAIGAQRVPSTKLAIVYPGVEGEKNYINAAVPWVYRSHPVTNGFTHSYSFRINAAPSADFSLAVRQSWRYHYDMVNPEIASVPVKDVYRASVDLLAFYGTDYNGWPGFPFSCNLPNGDVREITFQMGFVGQQLPAAHLLLRDGYLTGQSNLADFGRRILDFWATNSPAASGLPRTWWDIEPGQWRDFYPTYLRIATDGLAGVLKACQLELSRGTPATLWENFTRLFGDWLVSNQNPDGSYYRSYNLEGTAPDNTATYNTITAVPFLLDLANYTGVASYRDAAIRAGEFAFTTVHIPATYVGGTPDNDNVLDKEATALALRGFLALYQHTNEQQWLDAAQRAADFYWTWVYSWNYPVASDRPAYSQYGVRGQSLIATGHGAMDTWHSSSVFDIYQLYRATNDPYYLTFAQLAANNAKLTTQYAGNPLGYGRDGLLEEAIGLADLRYGGVNVWLPWNSVAHAEPLAFLEDAYGNMDINAL